MQSILGLSSCLALTAAVALPVPVVPYDSGYHHGGIAPVLVTTHGHQASLLAYGHHHPLEYGNSIYATGYALHHPSSYAEPIVHHHHHDDDGLHGHDTYVSFIISFGLYYYTMRCECC